MKSLILLAILAIVLAASSSSSQVSARQGQVRHADELAYQAVDLPKLNVDYSSLTVSGLSAGGAMAIQIHVAYSSLFTGVGVFAGIPFNCADGQMELALTECMDALPTAPSASFSISSAKSFASQGLIDDPSNLKNQRVYLYSGALDFTVHRKVMNAVADMYVEWAGADQIEYVTNITSGHTMPTDFSNGWFSTCGATSSPYISDCSYDGAGNMLQHLFKDTLAPRKSMDLSGKFFQFYQAPFMPSGASPSTISMGDYGYLYVPQQCLNATSPCKLHVVLHGCEQAISNIGLLYVNATGYNPWADANDMIMMYPQAVSSMMSNPNACWDWWGYNSNPSTYDTKQGYQLNAIKEMIYALGGKTSTPISFNRVDYPSMSPASSRSQSRTASQ